MAESVEGYIVRMLDDAREILAEIVSLSGVASRQPEVYDELEDLIFDFESALDNALREIRNV